MSLRLRQSRSGSLFEAVTKVVAGFLIAIAAQQLVFPVFGIATTLVEDAGIAAVFTGLSLVRAFAVRRLFERIGQANRRSGRVPALRRHLAERG
jgi:hypothetical protein